MYVWPLKLDAVSATLTFKKQYKLENWELFSFSKAATLTEKMSGCKHVSQYFAEIILNLISYGCLAKCRLMEQCSCISGYCHDG